jgi:hypothetical protein
VERGVAATDEEHQPSHGQADVQGGVGEVQRLDEVATVHDELLEPRLDVEVEPLLERDDRACVAVRALTSVAAQGEPAGEQVDAVEAEAERDLTLPGEAPLSWRASC